MMGTVCMVSIEVVASPTVVLPIIGSSSKVGIGSGYADGKKAGLPDRRFLCVTGSSARLDETLDTWSSCGSWEDDTRLGVCAALGVVDCFE